MMKRSYLILGGCSKVGINLAKNLTNSGNIVTIADNCVPTLRETIDEVRHGIVNPIYTKHLNITDTYTMKKTLNEIYELPEVIISCVNINNAEYLSSVYDFNEECAKIMIHKGINGTLFNSISINNSKLNNNYIYNFNLCKTKWKNIKLNATLSNIDMNTNNKIHKSYLIDDVIEAVTNNKKNTINY